MAPIRKRKREDDPDRYTEAVPEPKKSLMVPDQEIKKQAIEGRVYTCDICNKVFTKFQALGGHRASHRKPNIILPGGLKKLHVCTICGEEFTLGQALGGHMRKHRGSETSKMMDGSVPVLKSFPVLGQTEKLDPSATEKVFFPKEGLRGSETLKRMGCLVPGKDSMKEKLGSESSTSTEDGTKNLFPVFEPIRVKTPPRMEEPLPVLKRSDSSEAISWLDLKLGQPGDCSK